MKKTTLILFLVLSLLAVSCSSPENAAASQAGEKDSQDQKPGGRESNGEKGAAS